MINRFYIDESGNSGDVALSGDAFDFGGQPMFALACIGCSDQVALASELKQIATTHRIRSSELKSTALINKPEVARDILNYLGDNELPFFVEVVDKFFFLAVHMINHLVLPVVGNVDFSEEGQWLRNQFAEYLNRKAEPAIFTTFVVACNTPSNAAISACFKELLNWLEKPVADDEVGQGLHYFVVDSQKDFHTEAKINGEAFRRYLPIPDEGLSGRNIWMLPNLTSLTNLYARVNQYRAGEMKGVTLVHDEQVHFEDILLDAKATMEKLASSNDLPHFRFANYSVIQSAKLTFAQSHDHAGIQASDVLAGFIMRYVRDTYTGTKQSSPASAAVFHKVIELSDPERGIGVNFVMSHHNLFRLGVLPA